MVVYSCVLKGRECRREIGELRWWLGCGSGGWASKNCLIAAMSTNISKFWSVNFPSSLPHEFGEQIKYDDGHGRADRLYF